MPCWYASPRAHQRLQPWKDTQPVAGTQHESFLGNDNSSGREPAVVCLTDVSFCLCYILAFWKPNGFLITKCCLEKWCMVKGDFEMKYLSVPNCALMYISFKNCYFLITMNTPLNLNSLYYRGKRLGGSEKKERETERERERELIWR